MNDAVSPPAGSSQTEAAAVLQILLAAARLGGDAALAHFRPGERTRADVAYKSDNSPVTAADLEVDRALRVMLTQALPEAGWLSEETEDDPARLTRAQCVVVDPIDGTRAFMAGDPRWTVAIALVEAGRPIAGVVHAPALGETFAASRGGGATLNGAPIRAAQFSDLAGVSVDAPRGLLARFSDVAGFRADAVPPTPSLAYRFARVAAGRVGLALSSANANDWDVAAADIILEEAGAGLVERAREVSYNQPRTRHDPLLAAPREWLARLGPAVPSGPA